MVGGFWAESDHLSEAEDKVFEALAVTVIMLPSTALIWADPGASVMAGSPV